MRLKCVTEGGLSCAWRIFPKETRKLLLFLRAYVMVSSGKMGKRRRIAVYGNWVGF